MKSKKSAIWVLLVCVTCGVGKSPKEDRKEEELPPCQACKTVVSSFERGMAKTNKRHFGGGDTAWEEEKLGDYARSETRLVEVQEQLCGDVDRGASTFKVMPASSTFFHARVMLADVL
uniref:DUF3456 domain-containing protein n=1 Tax=Rhodnius prolixus TaxID=13249 RepID=T1HWN7_RHOPR